MSTRDEILQIVLISVLVAAAAGCGGRSDDEHAAAGEAADAAAGGAAVPPPAAPTTPADRMANAVPTAEGGAAVDLRYDLAAKPDVGVPFELTLEFKPRLPADALEIEVTGMPGLVVASGNAARFDVVHSDQPYTAKAVVSADAPGLYYVGVVARLVTKVQTETRSYSVPIVVGSAPVAAKSSPARDAQGEATEPMSAVESGG